VPCPCARVLVGVGCDVSDEFLGGEGEKPGQGERGAVAVGAAGVGEGGGWEAGEREVVGCYCIGDLLVGVSTGFRQRNLSILQTHNRCVVIHLAQKLS
jgi:hypothetical protein